MSEAIQIVTTFASKGKAEEVGIELVRHRLVACAQISGPITSIYRWHGAIETGEEYTLTLKTRRESFDAVAAALRKSHTYEVPEILAFDVAAGSDDYLKWIAENTAPAE